MKIKTVITALLLLSLLPAGFAKSEDEFSFANTDAVTVKHMDLNLHVNFSKQRIEGTNDLHLDWLKPGKTLFLDVRDLKIKQVYAWDRKWQPVSHQIDFADREEGQKLIINLPQKGIEKVRVAYITGNPASGLQWLTPEQTAGKKLPFMFSQSQAIHARSWIPSQDTPSVRSTYTAKVTTDLPLKVVMSADNAASEKAQPQKVYEFEMPQAIPSYLIAIAVGDLVYKPMSKRTGIFAEPSVVDSAVAEFDDTEKMIVETEKLYGPYLWGKYDLLILPPAFPYGGMENPRLSFITPTVIAGDKSLVNLIAHELAHSWSGNLVTNSNWRDLWINEGFTSYVENRIMEAVFGERRAVMEQSLAYDGIIEEMKGLEEKAQSLYNQSNYSDPDIAFSGVPYTKGQLFLHTLEKRVGRNEFDKFLRNYFNDYRFKSISTQEFLGYIDEKLISKHDSVDMALVNTWIFEAGIPKHSYVPKSDAFVQVEKAMKDWLAGKMSVEALGFAKLSVHEKLHFINSLPESVKKAQLAALDKQYQLTESTNAEIAFAWFMKTLEMDYLETIPAIKAHLASIGRMKLIVPLYTALAKRKDTSQWLLAFYKQHSAGYHPIAQVKIARSLKTNIAER